MRAKIQLRCGGVPTARSYGLHTQGEMIMIDPSNIAPRGVDVSVEALAEALRRAGRLVALTGAGISTESGIPDYRSPNEVGSWATPSRRGSGLSRLTLRM